MGSIYKELILNNEFSNLGIDVTDDEFFELLQGSNVHPEISKVPAFQDPNTGNLIGQGLWDT